MYLAKLYVNFRLQLYFSYPHMGEVKLSTLHNGNEATITQALEAYSGNGNCRALIKSAIRRTRMESMNPEKTEFNNIHKCIELISKQLTKCIEQLLRLYQEK